MNFSNLIFILPLLSLVASQCCNKFDGWKCLQCPDGTHLYLGHCLFNIPNCASYQGGFNCSTCETGFKLDKNGQCIKIPVLKVMEEQKPNQIKVDLQNQSGNAGLAFRISNDLALSLHPQLQNGKAIGAKYMTHKNESNSILIEYEVKKSYFQVEFAVNVTSFIFKEISFTQTSKPEINPPKHKEKIIKIVLNQKNQQHASIIEKIKAAALVQKPNIQSFMSGNMNLSDISGAGTVFILFGGKNSYQYEVRSQIKEDKTIVIKGVEQNQIKKEKVYKNEDLTQLEKNVYFSVVKDFIGRQQKYEFSVKKVKSYQEINVIQYILLVDIKDGGQQEITASIDTNVYLVKILSKKIIVKTQKKQKYVVVPQKQIFKDFYFIMVREQISKQLGKKYNGSTIESVFKLQTDVFIKYKITFDSSQNKSEVQVQIKKENFKISILKDLVVQQKKKQANLIPNTKNQLNSPQKSANNAQNQTDKTKNSSKQSETSKNSNIQEPVNINNNQNVETTSRTMTITTETKDNENKTSPKNQSLTQKNQKTEQKNQSTEQKKVNQEVTPETEKQKEKTVQLDIFDTRKLPFLVLDQVAGFVRTKEQQIKNDVIFQRVNTLLMDINEDQLSEATLLAVFTTQKGFSKVYKIFYIKSGTIFEGHITFDMLRKRSFIISFGKLGY